MKISCDINYNLSNNNSQIVFGTRYILKTLYENGQLDLTYGIYGGVLTRKKGKANSDTLEHIKPSSKHGYTKIQNLAIATAENNQKRSNKPLSYMFNKENFEQYCKQFKNVVIHYDSGVFIGNKYVEDITKTVKAELRKENRLDLLL